MALRSGAEKKLNVHACTTTNLPPCYAIKVSSNSTAEWQYYFHKLDRSKA